MTSAPASLCPCASIGHHPGMGGPDLPGFRIVYPLGGPGWLQPDQNCIDDPTMIRPTLLKSFSRVYKAGLLLPWTSKQRLHGSSLLGMSYVLFRNMYCPERNYIPASEYLRSPT